MEEDIRFAHIQTDPKFRRIPKSERKVKIDKRFKSMFKEKQFKLKYTIDKRGRPVNHTSNEDLKRYYELNSEEESGSSISDSENIEDSKEKSSKNKANKQSESDQLHIKHASDKKISNKVKKKLLDLDIDYARGEACLLSESSSDDDDDEEEDDSEKEDGSVVHAWGELDRDAEQTEEVTHRLAVCNMDWDRIRATDIMVLLNSFLPRGGLIHSVTIYPSEFGLQRIAEEEVNGPTELVASKKEEDEQDGHEGSKYHMEKLRQYQLNRLKYYYAVIVCDSKSTANKLYTECDGIEYESSATKVDLRFIPDDMEFEQEPKEVCNAVPEQGRYQPRFFTTTALQQVKVDLTWDETNPERIELTQKLSSGNLDDINNEDLQTYLASSSGEEEEETEEKEEKEEVKLNNEEAEEKVNSIDKYKALLQDIENREKEKEQKEIEMEVTWGINLKEKTKELVKKKLNEKEEKTPFQQYLDKRKEKQKAKRDERKKKHEKSASESDSDIPSDIDMNDPYFAEEFDKPEFRQKKNKKVVENSSEDDAKKAELELLLLNTDDDNKKHFSLQKIQEKESEKKPKKKLKKKNVDEEQHEDDFKINVADERFSALYSSHHFNVDPTDPHYKKTNAMEAIVNEKLKRRTEVNDNKQLHSESEKRNAELKVLVKSIKRKTEALNKANKRKKV